MNVLSIAEYRFILRRDFMSFVERAFYELNPQTRFLHSPYLEVMAARLAADRPGTRLLVTLPPRSLKSHMVSVALPAWLLGHRPELQIVCASYGQDLADKHARDCRTLMGSPFYRQLFPGTQLSPDKQSVNEFVTTAQGFRFSTSVEGVLTGRGGDVIIIDDPMKPDDALSDTRRKKINEWYDNTLLSRLNDKVNGSIIIVMQRLHQDDLVGHVLEQEDWDSLSFPAIAEEDEAHVLENAFGRKIYQRRTGDVLHPEREPLSALNRMRETIGTYNFASQYQQNPVPIGGAMVKADWLQRYESDQPLPPFISILQSWDTANKSGDLNDFSVCTTWGVYNGHYYLLDVFRRRLNYPDLRRAVQTQAKKHSPMEILIEDKASGTQLLQDLKYDGMFGLKAYEPPSATDKIMRVHTQTAEFENGRVLLPRTAPWLNEYVRELTAFPGCKYDDQVDSTVQALDYLKKWRFLETWMRCGGY